MVFNQLQNKSTIFLLFFKWKIKLTQKYRQRISYAIKAW